MLRRWESWFCTTGEREAREEDMYGCRGEVREEAVVTPGESSSRHFKSDYKGSTSRLLASMIFKV